MTIFHAFRLYPGRLLRFLFHFIQWVPSIKKRHLPSKGIIEWLLDLCFYIADLVLVPDILEFILVWFQPNIRVLSDDEKKYAREYFGAKIKLDNIRISESVPKRIKNLAIAFVTFHTIHFSEKISIPVFIHEMVHIWQYQKFGSVYIYRALKAQRSYEAYNYGGLENLYAKMIDNYIFTDFNFEQQGAIFEDYCRMKEASEYENPIAMASFEYFVGQVR